MRSPHFTEIGNSYYAKYQCSVQIMYYQILAKILVGIQHQSHHGYQCSASPNLSITKGTPGHLSFQGCSLYKNTYDSNLHNCSTLGEWLDKWYFIPQQ